MRQPSDDVFSRRAVLGGALATFSLAGCTATSEDGGGTATVTGETGLAGEIRVAGSSTVYPLTLEVANRFMDDNPEVSVSVSSTGTGGGFDDFFCVGKTDINDASRPISTDERDACGANGVEPVEFVVATDALTVVVNDDADWLSCVTTDQLAAIWGAGGAETWHDVDPSWPDEPIELHGPTTASGTFDYFAESVLGEVADHRTDYQGTEQDGNIVKAVEESRYAMGYLGFAYYDGNRDRVTALSVENAAGDCVAPSRESAREGSYEPLSRPLFIYASREALKRSPVASFVSFYLDVVPTALTADVGYVPIPAETARANRKRLESALE